MVSIVTPNLIIIILGIIHVVLYVFICWRKKKKTTLFNALEHFLNGFIPYAVYESFNGGITGKSIPNDHLQVILIIAGLSLVWLYYHVLKRLVKDGDDYL